ncbi:MAG: hypothetical protein AABM29_00315 [Actinomycetota bacterium]
MNPPIASTDGPPRPKRRLVAVIVPRPAGSKPPAGTVAATARR